MPWKVATTISLQRDFVTLTVQPEANISALAGGMGSAGSDGGGLELSARQLARFCSRPPRRTK